MAWGSCSVNLGRGWPPAVGNYGGAVEKLFDGDKVPALSLVTLPPRGVETGVALYPAADGGEWTLRYSRADERVYSWIANGARSGVQLNTEQVPESFEIPIPAALAQRLLSGWSSALGQMSPQGRDAPVMDGEVLSFVVNGVRYSGARPTCGAGELMLQQVALLIEASEGKEKKREKRWNEIESSLDELQQALAGTAG
ncbi:hypothetical protein C9J98_06165 [Stenotrophomonas panacihumi]|nr:hypothetical protein C9J98_06165 [Stenotrophomonas panacihumi]